MSSRLQIWWKAIRPKTLLISIAPVLVATALSFHLQGEILWHISLLALLCALGIQIATNLFNDAIDFKKGTDHAGRIGPQRAAQQGWLTPKAIFTAAICMLLVTIAVAIPLVLKGGRPILLVGLTSLLLTYLYTGGPLPLSYTGISEIFVLVFFGWIAVLGVVFLQTSMWPLEAWIAGTEIGLFACGLQGINNLRDIEGDTRTDKKTFAVRFGIRASRTSISIFFLLPFILNFFWWQKGNIAAALWPLISLPFIFILIFKLWKTDPSPIYNQFLWQGARLQFLFALLLAGGLL